MTAGPLPFHRPLNDIIADLARSPSPPVSQYYALLAAFNNHPETLALDALIAEQDAIEAVIAEQGPQTSDD